MPQRLGDLLARREDESFVGRAEELAVLLELLEEDEPLVVHVHGIPGVGKSSLLARFASHAERAGATVLALDCRAIEPTEQGFVAELSQHLESELANEQDAADALGGLPSPVVLILDHYEVFRLMDTWLRQSLVPAMPAAARLIIAGREPPVPVWLTSARWQGLFRSLELGPLDRASSLEVLRQAGVKDHDAQPLAAATGGNPLALMLAASAALARPDLALEDAAIPEVMQELTALFLADVEDGADREALRSTSVARRITLPLLSALGVGGQERWDALRRLPFVDAGRDGLRVHDAVREAIAVALHSGDPDRHLQCRRAVWRELRQELRQVSRGELWRYTADMLYLIENPVVREAFFPSGRHELAVEPAREEDRASIAAICTRHEGPTATRCLELWWAQRPSAFSVARDRHGEVVAFYCIADAGDVTAALRRADPIAAAWLDHLAREPMADGRRALLLRRWLGELPGEAPSAEQAACWLDIKRLYMELRPALQRVYLTVIDLATYAPVATRLGFRPLEDVAVELDGSTYHSALLDFGPASVDGWIASLVAAELGVAEGSLLDGDRKALVIGDRSVPLTPLEFRLLEYLEARAGATATRDELLREVWGHKAAGASSNVVDAVVKLLRGKMGEEAARLETVRGFGYRLRAGLRG